MWIIKLYWRGDGVFSTPIPSAEKRFSFLILVLLPVCRRTLGPDVRKQSESGDRVVKIFKNPIKIAIGLIIPTLVVVGIVEHRLREGSIQDARTQLSQKRGREEKKAVEGLVRGCDAQEKVKWLPSYLSERLFGNCRSLFQAPLNGAKLRYSHLRDAHLRDAHLRDAILFHADLRDADLRDAILSDAILSDADLNDANLFYADLREADLVQSDLSNADLSFAVLSAANLSDADLSGAILFHTDLTDAVLFHAYLRNADLSFAILSGTDLRDAEVNNANLSNAILLNTDFRSTRKLTQAQLEGDSPPLICNSPLSESIEIDRNRDCDQLATVLKRRYPGKFTSINQAEAFVNEQRQKQWE